MSETKENEGCLGYHVYNSNAHDFDCFYGVGFDCEECIFGACGGEKDPRLSDKE